MSMIGSWGKDIVFKVSSREVLTFQKFSRTISARWATHNGISGKPTREFQGIDLEQITLNIKLSALMGINVVKTISNLEKALKLAKANYLIIGGKRVTNYKYNLTKISESRDIIYKNGLVIEANLTLTFTEYN
jgi:hypothetical protein|nr:MAG TPA: hypothetical protein [Caudoviricetes sp.]